MTRYTRRHPNRCVETATFQTDKIKLDKDRGVLRGVKIVGLTSVKDRRYTEAALRKAQPLYDGAKVNLNHAKASDTFGTPDVAVQNRFGRIKNPTVQPDGLYGDLHYNPKHSFAPQFEWFAENDPSNIGLSHDFIYAGKADRNGVMVIESIPKVFSVDIVADPGSTRGLHESAAPESGGQMDLGESLYGEGDGGEECSPADEHLANAVYAIVKDTALAAEQKLEKIKVIVMQLLSDGEMSDDEDEPEPEETPSPEPEKKEKKKPKMSDKSQESAGGGTDPRDAEIAKLKADLEIYRAAESKAKLAGEAKTRCTVAGLAPEFITDTFVSALVARGNDSAVWEEMIEDRKKLIGGKVNEVTSAGHDKPKALTPDEFAAACRSGEAY